MLGVLKRRWKPSKRASSSRGSESPLNSDLGLDKPRPASSSRQIHPLYEEKAGLLGYCDRVGNTETFPPAPNLVVEGGRIEFVRPLQETPVATVKRSTSSKGSQTNFIEHSDKCSNTDKETLEKRVEELERALQAERLAAQRDRVIITKLQRQINKRDIIQRDAERERRQRMEAEARIFEVATEAERARSRVHHLQRELARIEESYRGLLQQKLRAEQLKQEKAALALSCEARVHQYQMQIAKLQLENESMRGQLRGLEAACTEEIHMALVARLASLESEHAALARDADAQRQQYERCLDDVANQVVRALLSQKSLREEIGALQRQIRELETQNRMLSGIIAQTTSNGNSVELIKGLLESGSSGIITALNFDQARSSLSRPHSLNLQIPLITTPKNRRNRTLGLKKPEEEDSESPESGNRDEGYSTMSSDVQGEGPRQEPCHGLEDLAEVTDETECDGSSDVRVIPITNCDTDTLFLPLNLNDVVNARHSYPPTKDLIPYQHVIRSFSDSHLCLKLTATTSLTPYNWPTPIGSSLFFLEEEGWDAEYVQQWLRLDESRSAQQNRDLLELEYDKSELEDWSFSLSTEDLGQNELTPWNESSNVITAVTAVNASHALPAIKEHNVLDLEEDANECLWNGASYLSDRVGGELVALLMDARSAGPWPYASSPGTSWSSEEGVLENSSKRSSATLSGYNDDPDSPSVGTDFTRDFYRLVKFESSKSLASTSSKSGKPQTIASSSIDREQAIHNVLSFIAEQQLYLSEMQNNTAERNFSSSSNKENCTLEKNGQETDLVTSLPMREFEIHTDNNEAILNRLSEPTSLYVKPSVLDERAINQSNNINVSHTAVSVSELGAVPEEDEEVIVSSTSSATESPVKTSSYNEDKHRTLSFHECATSKDVINELNRIIRKGDESTIPNESQATDALDLTCCCPTGWIHVEREIDFTDPKARANLLDVMLASSECSSVASSSGSAGSDSGDEPPDYRHLHRLHRYRRQKKASAVHAHRVLRMPSNWCSSRPSIIGREQDFFMRYGEKEREAVASFDFLNEMSVSSSSDFNDSLLELNDTPCANSSTDMVKLTLL